MVHRHGTLTALMLLTCLLTAAPRMCASPVYVHLGQDSILAGAGQTLALDLDANGTVDFILSCDSTAAGAFLRIAAPTLLQLTNKIAVTGNQNSLGSDEALALNLANTVNAALTFNGLLSGSTLLAEPASAGSDVLEGQGDVYLGVAFNGSGGTHYGWIRISVNAAGDTARVSGWGFESQAGVGITISSPSVAVTQITVHGSDGVNVIATDGGTLQMVADVLPEDASNKNVTWSLDNNTVATIDAGGLLHAQENGSVTVTGTAADGSGVSGSTTVVVSNQNPKIEVSKITVRSITGATGITVPGGTLAMVADIQPADASNKTVSWSVDNTTTAMIDADGILHAMGDGTVNVTATAADGSGVSGSAAVTISNQASLVHVSQIIVRSATGATSITTPGGTLLMMADVMPVDASNKAVTWSVDNNTVATIDAGGMLHAMNDGTVNVAAMATDGSGISGSTAITVMNQNPVVQVTQITVRSSTGATSITTPGGTLQMIVDVQPANATNPSVTWSVDNGATAMINPYGMLTATGDGQAVVTATAMDGSNVSGTAVISISGQTSAAAVAELRGITGSAPQVMLRGDLLTIELPEQTVEPLSVAIYDVVGRSMARQQSDGAVSSMAIDCSSLPSGVYLIAGQRRNGTAFTERMVLAR